MQILAMGSPLSTLKGPSIMYGWGTVKLPTDAWRTLCALPILNLCVYNKDTHPCPIPPWNEKHLLETQIQS